MSDSTLPISWTSLKLSEVGTWRGGGTPSKANSTFWTNGTIPWVSPKDMKKPRLSTAQDLITESAVESSATNLVATGSVLLVTRSGILAHSLPVAVNLVPVALNQDIKAVTPHGFIDAEYLCLIFHCFERDILNTCRKGGTTVHSIEFPALQDFTIPLPPMAEQKRIVAKIEELFSELEAGEESLRVARRQLGVYRQSLLKQAFEGKLTEKWRTQNPAQLESPAQLLARIQSARQARYEQQSADAEISHGIRLAKLKTPRPVAAFTLDETEAFHALPASWGWEKLGRLFRIVSGHTPKEIIHTEGGAIPYYRVSDMNAPGNELRMKASSTWLTESQTEELGLHIYPAGTVIFPKRGGAILTNKKRVLSRPSSFDLNTMGVINNEPSIDSEFLRWWFMKLDLSKIYDGSNIPQINNKNVEHLPFELPPLPEQQEIVRLLDEQFEVIERNEREIDSALKRSEALRQAILKKAFTGRLVPQDPADEPASALLARIRAEPTDTSSPSSTSSSSSLSSSSSSSSSVRSRGHRASPGRP